MEPDRPKFSADYGEAMAKIRDLRDEDVPLAEIMAALAKLHPSKAPVVDTGIDAEPSAQLISIRARVAAFIERNGLTFLDLRKTGSLEEYPEPQMLDVSFDELKTLPFIRMQPKGSALMGTSGACLAKTKDGVTIMLYKTESLLVAVRNDG